MNFALNSKMRNRKKKKNPFSLQQGAEEQQQAKGKRKPCWDADCGPRVDTYQGKKKIWGTRVQLSPLVPYQHCPQHTFWQRQGPMSTGQQVAQVRTSSWQASCLQEPCLVRQEHFYTDANSSVVAVFSGSQGFQEFSSYYDRNGASAEHSSCAGTRTLCNTYPLFQHPLKRSPNQS